MKKKIQYMLVLIIFMTFLFYIKPVNADEIIGMMKVYKLKINLINIDTEDYSIELIDGISNRIFETQEGNKTGEHYFAIATDMDERHLINYEIKIKFKDGEVKNFGNINTKKLIDVDDNKNDSSYNFEYNVIVNLIPRSMIITFFVILGVAALVTLVIVLKKHKRRIK